MKISIYRYLPEEDEAPRMQDYFYDLQAGEDMMVLDLLEHLKTQDPTLTYRRSCREGVCRSDGMNINGYAPAVQPSVHRGGGTRINLWARPDC